MTTPSDITRLIERARRGGLDDRLLQGLLLQAGLLARGGRPGEASRLVDEALDVYRRIYPHSSEDILAWDQNVAASNIVRGLLQVGRVREADALHRHAEVDEARTASLLSLEGKAAEAAPFWRRVLVRSWMSGNDVNRPWSLALYEAGYARCLMELGEWDEAKLQLQRAQRRLREWVGPGSIYLGQVDRRLAALQRRELDPWLPGGF